MSASSQPKTPTKPLSKTYAAAATPPRPIVLAVARLSLESTPPATLNTEPFPL